jgi:LSD1 subclass zinc finger protein
MENSNSTPAKDHTQFPCGQCGAKLSFDPGSSSLKCPYCGSENAIPKGEAAVEELDFRSHLTKVAGEKETSETQRIKCGKCGAETTQPKDITAGLCPFCGTNMVFSASTSRLLRPEGLLPFKVNQKSAFEDFRKWIKGLWFAPSDLKKYARSEEKLVGVYVPYWTYDSDTCSQYTGERGDYYYTTESYTTTENGREVTKTRQVRHTEWHPASGTVYDSFDDILILASKSLPKKHANQLEPWDLENMAAYADEYLSGFRAESYQITLGEGFEEAKEVMAEAIRKTIRGDIGGDEQRINSVDTRYGKITFKHILLPVWLSAYRYRDKVYRILVNARTGEVCGERPYSAWKIAGAVVLGLAIIAGIVLVAASRN